ncbi:ATP-binding protein [Staphylococcus sp. EZ-P03]|uniref:ATP-binding protein n=1 Tax=Staphylococcus sp. EZ-P03 TaxID=2282739 RepID=UPI000DF77E3B|nr:ATP-binding protein [Staphylococcus sp. EZ-P03]
MNRKSRIEKRELKDSAENLLVDSELHNRGKDNLEKLAYNSEKMHENIDQQINMKKDLLAQLRQRRQSGSNLSKNERRFNDEQLRQKLKSANHYAKKEIDLVEVNQVNTIDIDRNDFMTTEYNRAFANQENIELDNPFMNLYSKTEQVRITREIISKFELLELDKMDYLFAAGAGVLAGFVDAIYVGTIAKGKDAKGLQKFVDNQVGKLVRDYGLHEKIAMLNKQKENANSKEAIEKINKTISEYKSGERPFDLKSGIRLLEKNHKVAYDAATSKAMPGMSPDNHHLLSLGHDPSPLGLIVSIFDQINGKSTFISKTGDIVSVAAENTNNELTGNLPNKIIQASNNWFGHLMSDVSGSATSKGRGSGLPVPGWSSLQKLQFGQIPINNETMTMAKASEWMFKNGYDLRAFTTELIPVLIYETLIRMYWFYKQHFYYGKTVKESIPVANSRELQRLLLMGAASFSAVDVTHGVIKSTMKGGPQPQGVATFIMTVNKPGLLNLGFRSYQNMRSEIVHRKKVYEIIDQDIAVEYRRIVNANDIFG